MGMDVCTTNVDESMKKMMRLKITSIRGVKMRLARTLCFPLPNSLEFHDCIPRATVPARRGYSSRFPEVRWIHFPSANTTFATARNKIVVRDHRRDGNAESERRGDKRVLNSLGEVGWNHLSLALHDSRETYESFLARCPAGQQRRDVDAHQSGQITLKARDLSWPAFSIAFRECPLCCDHVSTGRHE